jgi:hypothetical protein
MAQRTEKPNGIANGAVEMRHMKDIDAPSAANDMLVGEQVSGVWSWVKKSLAEVKTILGLGSAAYTASTDYVLKSALSGRILIPFGVYVNISPMTAGAFPYTATIDRAQSHKKLTYALTINSPNDGSNYWNISLRTVFGTVKTLDTSALNYGVWSQVSTDTFDIDDVTSGYMLYYIYCYPVGAPGALYLAGPILEVQV